MKTEFQEYIGSIGITIGSTSYLRISDAIGVFKNHLLPDDEEILDIFISDYLTGDTERKYEDLFAITENYFIGANRVITDQKYDSVMYRGRIYYWELKTENYDFETASLKSRMSLEIYLHPGMYEHFKASEGNCDHLARIFKKYFQPGLEERYPPSEVNKA